MKKSLSSIFLILICYFGYGQTYPVNTNLNNVPTTLTVNNALKGKLIITSWADTSAANAENYLKNYVGGLIYTTGDSSAWYRTPNKWVKILPSGSVIAPEAWLTQGNAISPFSPVIRLGTANAYELPIQTNGVRRLTVPVDGLKRTSDPLYKYVMIDTSGAEHYLAYGDGSSGGSTLTSIGSGYAVGVTGTNNVKSLTAGTGISLDSSVNGQLQIVNSSPGTLAWSLTTNAGTNPSTNGLGTTDSVDLAIKTKGIEQIRLLASGGIKIPTTVDSTIGVIFKGSDRFIHNFYIPGTLGQNLFIGKKAGNFTMTGSTGGFGTRNLSLGDSTLFANTTGYRNVAVGINASTANTTGYENTAVGANAHEKNNTGRQNTAIGAISMQTNTTGERNAALGFSALQFNLTGTRNTAIGGRAMQFVQTGDANVAVGFDALAAYNSSANHNVAVGLDALYYSGGSNNVAVGDSTLWGLYGSLIPHLGYKNVAVGSRAGYHLGDTYPNFASIYDTACIFLGGNTSRDSSIPYTTSLQNMTVIGYDARGTASNQVTLGNNNVTSTLLKGSLNARGYGSGTHTGTATYNAAFDASGNIIEVASTTGTVTGTGTAGQLTKWTGTSSIGDATTGTGVLTALGVNTGSAGAFQRNNDGFNGTVGATTPSTGAFTTGSFSGQVTNTTNGAASTPPSRLSGTWFTGGTATTTKPQLLIEPTGTTSTAWSTSGTGLGVNAASGFTGNFLDAHINGGASLFYIGYAGQAYFANSLTASYFKNANNDWHIYGATTGTGSIKAMTLYNGSESGDVALQVGGTTTSYPAFVRNGTGIEIKLADNSAYTTLKASRITSTETVVLKGYTVATLPTGVQGMTAFCTDLLAPTFGATAVGGGAVVLPVFYDGTNWVVH